MKLMFKGFFVTLPAFVLVASLLTGCGTNSQQYSNVWGNISVGQCSKQFWPATEHAASAPSLAQSVYFISGVHLYALNAGNGAMRWCMSATYSNDNRLALANAGSLLSMPDPPAPPEGFSALTVSNNIIYTSSMNGNTYAFNGASGALIWQHNTGFANTSAPTVVDGTVYVGSGNIYALNVRNGSERWKFPTSDVVTTSPMMANNVLYAGSYDNHIYALNASTGGRRWQYNTGGRVYINPIVAAGTIFFGAGDEKPTLYAIRAQDGKLLWHNNMPVESSLAIANGVLYAGSRNNLYALNPQNGAILWHRPIATPFTPLVANKVIYIASSSDGMYALNTSNGTLRWHNPLNPMAVGETTIPLLLDGRLFVATIDLGTSLYRASIYALNPGNGAEDWHASVAWNVGTIGIAA